METHKQIPHTKKVVYRIDPELKPAIMVHPGEEFIVKATNAFGKSFASLEEFEDFFADHNKELKASLNHPCTGPIQVITDKKNISLAIHILDIKVTCGYQCISTTTGFLKDQFKKRQLALYKNVGDCGFDFKNQEVFLHGSPKIGFLSTIDNISRSPGRMSAAGGNIDINLLDSGSIIYLPVNHESPRILVGDLHISQGNGEVAGIGIEADGTIKMKVEIVDKIDFPIIDHRQNFLVTGWGESIEIAIKQSTQNMISFLKRVFPFSGWDDHDIYKFISAEGNIILGNSTGHIKTCALLLVKKRLKNKYGFSIL